MSNFGYLDHLHVHPVEAPLIRLAVDQLIAGQTTFQRVASEWNALGVRRRSSTKPWTGPLARQALSNDRFGGVRRVSGQIVDLPPIWMPLFSRAKWDALSVLLTEKPVRRRYSYNGVNLSRGIAFCHCGAEMRHSGFGNRKRYLCWQRNDKTTQHAQIADHLLDGVIRERVLDILRDRGTEVLTYTPRALDVLTTLIGAKTVEVETIGADDAADAVLRQRAAAQDLTVLEGERDDRLLYDALQRLSGDPLTMAAEWDRLPLAAQHAILRYFATATVYLGKGTGRVAITDLLA